MVKTHSIKVGVEYSTANIIVGSMAINNMFHALLCMVYVRDCVCFILCLYATRKTLWRFLARSSKFLITHQVNIC